MDTTVGPRGGFRIILASRELIALITILAVLGPSLIFVGRLTNRVESLELYREQHEATTIPLKEMLQRDHEIVLMLQESQKLMAANVTEVIRAVSANAQEIAVLRESQKRKG